MDAADDFLKFAAECEQMAQRTSDREGKFAWRELAQQWLHRAELRQTGEASQGAAPPHPDIAKRDRQAAFG
jgi:hypothetical protein